MQRSAQVKPKANLPEVRDQLGGVQAELKAERGNVASLTTEQKGLVKSIGALEGQLSAAQVQAEKAQAARDEAMNQVVKESEKAKMFESKFNETTAKLIDMEKAAKTNKGTK